MPAESRHEMLPRTIGLLFRNGKGYNGQIDRAAPGMSGFFGNISIPEEMALIRGRVKFAFRFGIVHVLCPSHEVIDGPLGPIAIVDLDGQGKSAPVPPVPWTRGLCRRGPSAGISAHRIRPLSLRQNYAGCGSGYPESRKGWLCRYRRNPEASDLVNIRLAPAGDIRPG